MNIIITSKNVNASDHLKDIIEQKFEKLSKYFSREIVANITLSQEKDRKKFEATINANGTIFRAEDSGEEFYVSVDKVVDRLSSQMSKFKSKLQRKHKDSKAIVFADLPDNSKEEDINIVKRKRFDITPMSTEEAVLQMELLHHNFFIFQDMDTDTIAVAYKRKEGNYGVLETSF
jgi:putative sigma-54 modulation protein